MTVNSITAALISRWVCLLLVIIPCFGLYLLRRRLLELITPRGFPGIPAYPYSTPFLGDIPRIAASLKKYNKNSAFFDQVGKDLGRIAQVRIAGLKK